MKIIHQGCSEKILIILTGTITHKKFLLFPASDAIIKIATKERTGDVPKMVKRAKKETSKIAKKVNVKKMITPNIKIRFFIKL